MTTAELVIQVRDKYGESSWQYAAAVRLHIRKDAEANGR